MYCVYMFMCVATCVQVDVCRGQRLVFMFSSVALSLTPELTGSRRTAGQQAPEMLLCLPSFESLGSAASKRLLGI